MSISSQHHSFDIAIAKKYGIEGALLIHHFQHWVRINKQAGRNQKSLQWNGEEIIRTFTYQSRREIALQFPYFNYYRVKYLCEKLIQDGVLIVGNFNKSPMDKTLWYAFRDEKEFGVDDETLEKNFGIKEMFAKGKSAPSKGKSAPSKGKSAQPIPDTKPDSKASDVLDSGSPEPIPSEEEKKDLSELEIEQGTILVNLCRKYDLPFGFPLLMKWIVEFGSPRVGANIHEFLKYQKTHHVKSPEGWVYKAIKDNYAQQYLWAKTNRSWLTEFVKHHGWNDVEITVSYAKIKRVGKQVYFNIDPIHFNLALRMYYEQQHNPSDFPAQEVLEMRT